MEGTYYYHANAQFHQHDRSFVALEQGVPRLLHFSAPPEFGGEPGVWTPEHFFLAAVASCFIETFKVVAKASKLEFQGIEVGVDGLIEKDAGGLRFTKITIRPTLIAYSDDAHELGLRVLTKTERNCLIVRSLSSQIELEPKILVEKPVMA
ncbi:MAG TPA: OsmC family protein [Terriglobales bacterium]|nr:OsmC family protein [Terriglobales bacterium]